MDDSKKEECSSIIGESEARYGPPTCKAWFSKAIAYQGSGANWLNICMSILITLSVTRIVLLVWHLIFLQAERQLVNCTYIYFSMYHINTQLPRSVNFISCKLLIGKSATQ